MSRFPAQLAALAVGVLSAASAHASPTTSVDNRCTSAGGTGDACGTHSQCAANAYATRCVQHVAGDSASRRCEIPCEADPSRPGTPYYGACSDGETCTASGGDGQQFCRASRFRMDLNLLDQCIAHFLGGVSPPLGSTNECSLEANLARLLDQNGDRLFDVFDVEQCIQSFLEQPSCDVTTGRCPFDDLVFCSADDDCGSGLHCDTEHHRCSRVCGLVASREVGFDNIDRLCSQPLTTCDYDRGSCAPVDLTQTSCEVDRDCPQGAYCFLGQCAPLCYRSIDCPGSDWYCTDNNRCRTLPSLDAQPGFVFEPRNYSLLFAQPSLTLTGIQPLQAMPVLIMDLVTKRQVVSNPAVSFGYRLEVTYDRKLDPKCTKEPAQWTNAERLDCLIDDTEHYVEALAPFGTVFAVGSPSLSFRLDTAAAARLTPGRYSAKVRVIFENGSSDTFRVLYEKTTPSGEYVGTFQVTLDHTTNNLAPSMPFNVGMKLKVSETEKTWISLLTEQGIQPGAQDLTDLSSGYVIEGLLHGNGSLPFADTTRPAGNNEIPVRGLYSPQLGWMRLVAVIDLPEGFCVDEKGVCPATGSTTALVARNVFGRRIRRLVQFIGSYDDTSRRFFGTYRETVSGLVPGSIDLTLDGAFLLRQAGHDDAALVSPDLLPAGAPATVAFPANTSVAAELDREIAATCAPTDAASADARARLGTRPAFLAYGAQTGSSATRVFPSLVSFEEQIQGALEALPAGGGEALTIYDFLSGRIALCGASGSGGPQTTPAPGCVDEKKLRCGLALVRKALMQGWVPPFPTSDAGGHQLFCSSSLPTADCAFPQPGNPALFAHQEHGRFDEELSKARKFQADRDLSDAFFALYRNRVNPFAKDAALAFKKAKLESAVRQYDALVTNIAGTSAAHTLFSWPMDRFQRRGKSWMESMEAVLGDRLEAVQQLVDLRRRVLAGTGRSDHALAEHLAQIEYLVNVYLMAMQRQWNGTAFAYDGAGEKMLQKVQLMLLQLDDAKNPLGISPNAVFFENSSLDRPNWRNYLATLAGDDGHGGLLATANGQIGLAVDNLKASLSDVDTFERSLQDAQSAFDEQIEGLCGPEGAEENLCGTLKAGLLERYGSTSSDAFATSLKCTSNSALGGVDVCAAATQVFAGSAVTNDATLANLVCPLDTATNTITVSGQPRACVGGELGALLLERAGLEASRQALDQGLRNQVRRMRNFVTYAKAQRTDAGAFSSRLAGLEESIGALELALGIFDDVVEPVKAFAGAADCTIIAGLAFGTDCPGHVASKLIEGAGGLVIAGIHAGINGSIYSLNLQASALDRGHGQSAEVLAQTRELQDMIVDLQAQSTEYTLNRQELLRVAAQLTETHLKAQAAVSGREAELRYIVDHLVGRETGSILVGNHLVLQSEATFRKALNVAYRTVMAFAHRYNIPAAQLSALQHQVFAAVTVEDLESLVRELLETERDYCGREGIDCDSFNNLDVMRLSLRTTLFPKLRDIVDPTTGAVVTKGQQFHNIITAPPFLKRRIVGTHAAERIELPFTVWLQQVGEGLQKNWMVNPLECNHVLDWDSLGGSGNVAVNFVGTNLGTDPSRMLRYELGRGHVDWLRACHPVAESLEPGTAPVLDYPIASHHVGYAPQSQYGQQSQPPTFYTRSTNLGACIDSAESAGVPQDGCWQFFGRDRSLAAPDWSLTVPLWVDGGDTGNAWVAGTGLPEANKPVIEDIIIYFRYRTRPISDP